MYKSEILEILKTSKKYSKSNFIYTDDYSITYIIGENSYKIEHYTNIRYYVFLYENYSVGINPIKVRLLSRSITEKSLLAGFGKIITAINKFDFILKKRKEDFNKIEPVILSFISKRYNLNIDSGEIKWRLTLPQTSKYVRRKWRSELFDVTKYKITYDIIHSIYMTYSLHNDNYCFEFEFNPNDNKLILTRKDDRYRNFSKDITKIIRSERLKKLMLISEENGNI